MQEVVGERIANYDAFFAACTHAATVFSKIPLEAQIKVVSHLDADGLCSAAIMINALIKLNRTYSLSIIQSVTEDAITPFKDDSEKYFIFLDLGSANTEVIARILFDRHIFIMDHHMMPERNDYTNITQVNPHLYGIDGSTEISGSGVAFFFTNALINNMEMARIAIVGAIGDVQENNGFKKLNTMIVDLAVQHNIVEVRRGIRLFGVQTRPLYKVLQYSSDVLIPGVSGTESGTIAFLKGIGIEPRDGKGWRKIGDLTEDEKKRLAAAIIMKRANMKDADDIFCNYYLLSGEDEDSPFREAKEFSTLLNSCGRLHKASIGIGACLNDARMKTLAIQNLAEYRKAIVNAMNWYKESSTTSKVVRGENYIIINAEEEILPTMIGTLGSMLSKSNDFSANTYILSLARNYDATTKISLRVVGNPAVNLKDIICTIITRINHGSFGGHSFAAGAVIETSYEDAFIKTAQDVLLESAVAE